MNKHSCHTDVPRPAHITPCGHDKNVEDPWCRGCADNPATINRQQLDRAVEETAISWAKRWER